jgi:hypothetical protein
MPAFVALFSGYVMSMFYRSFLAIVAGDLIVQFLSGVFIDHAEAAAFGAVLLATAAIYARSPRGPVGEGRLAPAQ